MNVSSIANKILKASELSVDDWNIDKEGKNYSVTLKGGLSLEEKQQMTQKQVDFHRKYEEQEIGKMAKLFNEIPGTFGIFINV